MECVSLEVRKVQGFLVLRERERERERKKKWFRVCFLDIEEILVLEEFFN